MGEPDEGDPSLDETLPESADDEGPPPPQAASIAAATTALNAWRPKTKLFISLAPRSMNESAAKDVRSLALGSVQPRSYTSADFKQRARTLLRCSNADPAFLRRWVALRPGADESVPHGYGEILGG